MTDPKAQAMAVLQKNHLRVTKQRKTLIDLLVANPDRYVSVTEVDKHMRQAFPGASHNTSIAIWKSFKRSAWLN